MKSVKIGKVVCIKEEHCDNANQRARNTISSMVKKAMGKFPLSDASNLSLSDSSLYTVITDPKMKVYQGHEVIVVDLMSEKGEIHKNIPLHILEAVV